MRSIIVVALVLCAALAINAEEYDLMLHDQPMIEDCLKETGAAAKDFAMSLGRGLANADEKINCTVACYFKAKGFIKDDGSVDSEKLIEWLTKDPSLPRDMVVKGMEKCGIIKEDNDCNTAHNLFVCVVRDIVSAHQ